ncbi:hypothetical protein E2320_016871 [Naja naja]|nr:hypothetical protein E2320_016871 [Naja naja]
MSKEKAIREDQVEILEYNFTRISKNPDSATLDLIAAEAGLSVEEVLEMMFYPHKEICWVIMKLLMKQCNSVKKLSHYVMSVSNIACCLNEIELSGSKFQK